MRNYTVPILALLFVACASREPNVPADEPAMPQELEVPLVEAPEAPAEATQPPAPEGSAEAVVEPIACADDDACGEGQFCEFPIGGCGEEDTVPCGDGDDCLETGVFLGTCMDIPEICTLQLDPVCGCDGVQYGNQCGAYAAGVSVRTLDTCDGSPPF